MICPVRKKALVKAGERIGGSAAGDANRHEAGNHDRSHSRSEAVFVHGDPRVTGSTRQTRQR
ncbi:MAG: hypothetical protein L0Z07_01225 [Planctomycetes bacterium]|nr:hypothetical protein [Planctomycetota bacterium]